MIRRGYGVIKALSRQLDFAFVYLAGVTLLGIYLRVLWVLKIPSKPVFDFATFQEIATNIFRHRGHTYWGQPIAFQGMAYQTVLGYLYRLVGSNDLLVAKLFNVVLSSLTLVAFLFILRKLTDKKPFILTAYTLLALLPNYIAYNNVVGTEVFFTFFFVLVVLLQLLSFDGRLRYPLLGVFTGIAALTKPFLLAYPVVVGVTVWLQKRSLKTAVLAFVAVFLVMCLVVAPWTYRNYRVFGHFIPVSYNAGLILYTTNNDNNTTGMWMPLTEVALSGEVRAQVKAILRAHHGTVKLSPELDAVLGPQAVEWIKEHPGRFLELGFLRLKQTFFAGASDIRSWAMNDFPPRRTEWEEVRYQRNLNAFIGLCDAVVYLLSSFGLIFVLLNLKGLLRGLFKRDFRLDNLAVIPTLNILYFATVYFVFEGQPRYNFPVLFLLVICLAWGIEVFRTRLGAEGAQKKIL